MPPAKRTRTQTQTKHTSRSVLAAIDVGTNAVRLELARPSPDGALEILHQERDPIRPGEGVFKTGVIPPDVASRLVSTMRRYAGLCRRHDAYVRAVATSAVREARNRDEIVRRVREEADIHLEVVSGKEEARLICVGVLYGKPAEAHSLCIDIGGGSTEVASAVGERPSELWSVSLGSVRLADLFDASGRVSPKQLRLMRGYASEALSEVLPEKIHGAPPEALGSSGTIAAVVEFASGGEKSATRRQITRAVEKLVEMGPNGRKESFDARRADIIVAGAVILEAVVDHLRISTVTAVDRGLRDGLLLDLMQRLAHRAGDPFDHSLAGAALDVGHRFRFDERHARHVAHLALRLFDDLAALHKLPAMARSYLEVAALLHDIGHAVSYQKHHRHTYYLIQNADIPGLADWEREVVARIARFHRRSAPDAAHDLMVGLTRSEANWVRKLATILRVADSLDRSHSQPVDGVRATHGGEAVNVRITASAPVDLELWDAAHETPLFKEVFGRRVTYQLARR
jgi:exopolyphosphatase / guanosine-5'-triphosphate,3'-diphosphate pyrophosphatase